MVSAMPTALITGASSGIGAACATALAERGFHVCLTARRQNRLLQLADEINARSGPGRAISVAGDATDKRVREETIGAVISAWGRLDVLVNNAGTALGGAIEEVDVALVRQEFELNVFACLAWMQLAGPVMRRQRAGRIINMSSVSGRTALPCSGAYAASKFALEALSDAARVEYAPWGVRVILVEPGSVATEIWERSRQVALSSLPNWESSPFRGFYLAQHDHVKRLISGRAPGPEVVARAVCKAATARHPKARYPVLWETRMLNLVEHLPTFCRDWLITRMLRAE